MAVPKLPQSCRFCHYPKFYASTWCAINLIFTGTKYFWPGKIFHRTETVSFCWKYASGAEKFHRIETSRWERILEHAKKSGQPSLECYRFISTSRCWYRSVDIEKSLHSMQEDDAIAPQIIHATERLQQEYCKSARATALNTCGTISLCEYRE